MSNLLADTVAVVAIDAGTTGVRARAVVAGAGANRGETISSYREFPQYFPRPGWVEHDAEEIWDAVVATLGEVLGRLADDAIPVAAIGITNQRETVVAWDRDTGRPRHRAIVWQDRRTADECDRLAPHLELVRGRTGLVLDPYFSGTKAAWMLRHGGVDDDARLAIGTVDAWLVWKLTGGDVFATDVTNASRTMLFDIDRLEWSDEMCALLGVPRSALPEVLPSSGRFGATAVDGLPRGIPVSGVAGDQQAALFGQACFEVGMAKNTYGTGSFVLMNVGDVCPAPTEGMLTTVAWSLAPGDATYALEGSIFVTGSAVQWLRDGLGIISDSAEVEALAASVPDTGDLYFVPALTGLGSPWWDPRARGALVGITRGTNRGHLARATLESMAFQTKDVVDAMARASGVHLAELRVDGGAARNDTMLAFQASELGVAVVRPADTETTSLGAAWLAGLAEGVWSDIGEVAREWRSDRRFEPGPPSGRHGRWLEALRRSLDWSTD